MMRLAANTVRFFSAVLFLFLAGCFRIDYHTVIPAAGAESYKQASWQEYFALGLIPAVPENDYRALCHHDTPVRIRSYQTPANVIATILGIGLTSGRTLEVECSRGERVVQRNSPTVTERTIKNTLPWWRRGF
jgi:hypothetical protein